MRSTPDNRCSTTRIKGGLPRINLYVTETNHKRWHDSRLASRVPETNPVIETPVRLIECQDLVGREEGHHLFEPGARSILVAPKSEVLYALAAQVVRMQHAA